MDDTLAAKLQVGDGSQGVLEQERLELQALKSEKFRTRWLERNRPWLLTHLYELIPKEVIRALNPSAVETLRDLQSDIVRIGQGVRKPTGGRGEISSDDSDSDDDEEERERRRLWERQPLRGHDQHAMATNWISAARKRLRFDKVTRGIRDGALESACCYCGRGRCNLHCRLANEDGLDGLIKAFESKCVGTDAENLDQWKAFYRRNASFYTVCANCRDFKPEAEEVARRMARGIDISSSDEDDDDGPRFSGPIQLPGEASGVMMGWLQKARRRLDDEGGARVVMPEIRSPVHIVDDVGRALLTSWVEHARNNNRAKAESRGEDIRNEITDILNRIPANEEWLIGSLREDGKRLADLGKSLTNKRTSLARQHGSDIEAIRSTLSQIEADCTAELQSIDTNERQDLGDARTQHNQNMAERSLELSRAGIGEEALEDEMARARWRSKPALLQKETEIKNRHQNRREMVSGKLTKARANAEAAIASLNNRFDNETSTAEKDFRAEALRWTEIAKRRVQVLESERRK